MNTGNLGQLCMAVLMADGEDTVVLCKHTCMASRLLAGVSATVAARESPEAYEASASFVEAKAPH